MAGTVVVALVGGGLVASPALADTAALTVDKTVGDGLKALTVLPGGEFTYSIQVGCDDNDCVDAKLADALPAAFAGFTILDTSVQPSSKPATKTLTGCTDTVTANCALSVVFGEPVAGGVGIPAGGTYLVTVTLKVPQGLTPQSSEVNHPVTNTAVGTFAGSATPVTSSADVTVNVPTSVDVAVGKTWTPASQQYQPGAQSTVSLTAQNASNVPASTLTLQDPATAADAATALDAANPFALVDFAGFGGVVLPQGATTVQVDAYVRNPSTGAWAWQTGPPAAPAAIALPAGVQNADVGGLRFTFAGADGTALTEGGAAGSVGVLVAQRSTNRQSGAALVTGASVTNRVAGTVVVPDRAPVTKTATAPFAVGGLTVAVTPGKQITPARIPAGTTATATVSGKNASNGPLDSLTLSDVGYFTDTLRFGGFAAGISYPSGATAAQVVWHFSDGSTQAVPFADGATPVAPSAPAGAHLTGLELAFTGAVAVGAVATAQLLIAPTADFAAEGAHVDTTNTLTVTGVNAAGSASKQASAPLAVFYPDIELTLNKTITPSAPVSPGATVTAQLPATTSSDSAYVRPTSIVIEDVWRPGVAGDFFNGFDPVAIAPTQVLKGSTLQVEYTTDGVTWSTLATVDATAAAQTYRAATLPAGVTGLRFTFADAAGFAQGTTVRPSITAQARSTLRDGSGPTSTAGAAASTYANHAVADTQGAVDGTVVTGAQVTADANAKIQSTTGAGSLGIAKKWTKTDLTGDVTDLASQSGAQAGTLLSWGVTDTGYSSVTITDPAGDPAHPESTVFQSFDLLRVSPIPFTADPALKWDTVSSVQLFRGGAWVTVPAPAGGWKNGAGFVGYTLTAAETADTTGVRITVVPDDAARATATDPTAPPAGSGVATVAFGQSRPIGLVWQLRNVQRVPSDPAHPWVTQETSASVDNVAQADGVQNGTNVPPVTGHDTVALIDQPPAVSLTKSSSRSTVVVPHLGDVDPADYPTNTFTLTAQNTATSRASYLRVTDPSPCDAGAETACLSAPSAWGADPFAGAAYSAASPFERLDLTRIAFAVPAGQVDSDSSLVTLWHRAADGSTSTSVVSLRTAAALTAADLADVVGVSVVYQGASPQTTGGTIASGQSLVMTLETRVRAVTRSTGAPVTAFRIDNHAFAQGYDPVLVPSGQGSQPYASSDASLSLTTGALGVTAAKTISPSTLLERDRTAPVTVTLTATSGAATAATHQVVVTDDDPAFWNRFALTGLSAGDVTLPAGADLVRVDAQTGGGTTWIMGTPAATASLPTAAVGQITGLRFTFLRADGGLFSRSAVPAGFTATVVLHVALLGVARDGSAIPFPGSVSDTVDTVSHRTDTPPVYADATASATAGMTLAPGTASLDVAKTPLNNVHTVAVGDTVPWTLTFASTGTGYLDLTGVTDTLPASLAWDGETPTFTTSAGGTLSTSPAVTYDAATGRFGLTWPAGGARMSPGERFTVVLGLILKPGLAAGDRATNQFVVSTVQNLTACTNGSGNGQGVLSGLPATQCGTTNYVQPVTGPSLYTTKGVQGDVVGRTVSGAINPTAPSATCRTDADGYYAAPCAANTVVGGIDQWRLNALNTGTVDYTSVVFVDPLPTVGDRMLATGGPRGSTFRPVFDGAAGVTVQDVPAGTAVSWEVTTEPGVCLSGTATAWPTDPTCAAHPAAWTASGAFTGDWADVTGIRVTLDFAATASGALRGGEGATVLYRTIDRPATATAPDGAPVSLPASPAAAAAVAWNQFGATAALVGGGSVRRAPVKAGVTIATGPLQVDKVVTGAAASAAPDEFGADIACTVAGVPVDLGAAAHTLLKRSAGFTARLDGLPIGSDCTIAESGAAGSYGEASRAIANGTVHIGAGALQGAVPAGQITTITNTFEYGRLELAKTASAAVVGLDQPVTYTITVTNIGALDATAFDVVDTLPAGAHFVSADQGGTLNAGKVTWNVASLAKGASLDLHVVVTYSAEGYPVNAVTVTTPPVGPWQPPAVDGPCASDPGSACATIYVDPPVPAAPSGDLARTGSGGDYLLVAFWAGLLVLAGAALLGRRRRKA
ncbi:DUF5979 domain-containing protein [Leifsonia shinshuensis]|uniref:Putative repeat protein (TIGR01451 family) n=1 Tax=Leifsonia shinshuensis TaxID=150026 RepID=A0A853CRE1_9MICO|nr:DUF5979 domain-containing protein [Leifsonia shinshuensis]NYJ22982.1 putative repeat protein (TIGR01451 family) [Leifsonia shinshuensis]